MTEEQVQAPEERVLTGEISLNYRELNQILKSVQDRRREAMFAKFMREQKNSMLGSHWSYTDEEIDQLHKLVGKLMDWHAQVRGSRGENV